MLALGLLILSLAGACSSSDGSAGGTTTGSLSEAGDIPACEAGATITEKMTSTGCLQDNGSVAAAFTYGPCVAGGDGEFVLFGDGFWGQVGEPMEEGDSPGDGEAARDACLNG